MALVASDAAIEYLFLACLRVEAPARGVLDDGNGKGPLVLADAENGLGVARSFEFVRLVVGHGETLAAFLVGDRIARGDDRLGVGSEDLDQRPGIARPRGRRELLRGLLG